MRQKIGSGSENPFFNKILDLRKVGSRPPCYAITVDSSYCDGVEQPLCAQMPWRGRVLSDAPDCEIAQRVCAAIDGLFSCDAALFEVDANERSISHRLAQHVSAQFPEWDTDCEYNRDRHEPKRLIGHQWSGGSDTDGSRVFPDIIVHRRKTRQNHLVIELKKSNSSVPKSCDISKLRAFVEELCYRHALFLCFKSPAEEPEVTEALWIGKKDQTL